MIVTFPLTPHAVLGCGLGWMMHYGDGRQGPSGFAACASSSWILRRRLTDLRRGPGAGLEMMSRDAS